MQRGGHLRDEAVAVAVGELEDLVVEEQLAEERDREGADLDVARVFPREEHRRADRVLERAAVIQIQLGDVALHARPAVLGGLFRRLLLLCSELLRRRGRRWRLLLLLRRFLAVLNGPIPGDLGLQRLLRLLLRLTFGLFLFCKRLLLLLSQLLRKELCLTGVETATDTHARLQHALLLLLSHLGVQLLGHGKGRILRLALLFRCMAKECGVSKV